jgi:DNA-binding NarL/FixJ family response regulator
MTENESPRRVQKRIMVVDDHPMTRNGIADWIRCEQDLRVCAEAQNAEQALEAVSKSNPDLVLTDITLPGKSGLELIKDLRAMQPDLPILVISMHDESLYAERVLRAGARGYIMKREAMDKVMTAIRRVLGGEVYVSEKMASRMVQKLVNPSAAAGTSFFSRISNHSARLLFLNVGARACSRAW